MTLWSREFPGGLWGAHPTKALCEIFKCPGFFKIPDTSIVNCQLSIVNSAAFNTWGAVAEGEHIAPHRAGACAPALYYFAMTVQEPSAFWTIRWVSGTKSARLGPIMECVYIKLGPKVPPVTVSFATGLAPMFHQKQAPSK